MKNNLYRFNVPEFYNPYDRSDIICCLETLAVLACGIAGLTTLEEALQDDDYEPEYEYETAYDELVQLVEEYNHDVRENMLNTPLIRFVIDKEKTNLLKNDGKYPIYAVVVCDGQI